MAVYKHGKTYWYDFTFDGTRHQGSCKTRNQAVAKRVEAKKRLELTYDHHGMVAPKATPNFKVFAEGRFLDHMRDVHKGKPRTIQYYEEKVRRLVETPEFAQARLREIDGDRIERHISRRAGQQRKPASINRELATLRHILRTAADWNLLRQVPKIIQLPGESQREFVLTYDIERMYLEHVSEPLKGAAILMLDTGLRPGECVHLEWERHIRFTPAPNAQFGYVMVTEGKTKNAKRNIPLTARAKEILEERRALFPKAKWVFPGQRKGKPLTIWALDNLHAKVRRETIDDQNQPVFPKEFVVYSLRHTFGTRLGESGAPPFTIMKLMGHASITTSQKYSHPTPEHLELVMARK
jgi:integrase